MFSVPVSFIFLNVPLTPDFYTSHLELNCFSRLVFQLHPCVLNIDTKKNVLSQYTESERLHSVLCVAPNGKENAPDNRYIWSVCVLLLASTNELKKRFFLPMYIGVTTKKMQTCVKVERFFFPEKLWHSSAGYITLK